MWSLLFDITLKANFYAKFEIKGCYLYFLLFIRNRECANQTELPVSNLSASACFGLGSSPIAEGGKKRCTWKRMDPCLHIMSARISIKHVWTWHDLSKGFDSQVGTLCIGTAVVIPAGALCSSPQRIPPPLQGCLGWSWSSWTATVYNQTS